tara:strand:- start:586 stop:1551 length:966 start_codon:yes stop_codon:yes gene_type:complete
MRSRTLLILLLAVCLIAPVIANPNGPPWENSQGDLTVEGGCTCHGVGGPVNGQPSTEVVVSISGIPRSYDLGVSYDFTINLQHASYDEGGFMLWSYGVGTLTAGEGQQQVPEEPTAVSHSEVGNGWIVSWTAPDEDVGEVSFTLVGNAVDGQNGANEGDKWNILSFFISAPDSTTNDDEEGLALRTISVGDFESLFVADIDPAVVEAERQEGIADDFFTNGNIFYWSTLAIILVGAVVQGEFYERRFGGGPKHLDMRLALPQGIRRGILGLGLLLAFGWAVDNSQPWGYSFLLGICTLWAMFGVYRTIVQARAEPNPEDLV